MTERRNAGYTITDSIHIGKAEFVIGEHPKAPSPYVTWECSDGSNYFWGHYFTDRRSAEKNLIERAQAELSFAMRQEEACCEVEKADGGDRYNAMEMEYEPYSIFGRDALFTDVRIDRHSVPMGIYAYDVRHDDAGEPCMLEHSVHAHFYGSVILNQPIALGKYGCKAIRNDDCCFLEGNRVSLSEFMKAHPPKQKEAER